MIQRRFLAAALALGLLAGTAPALRAADQPGQARNPTATPAALAAGDLAFVLKAAGGNAEEVALAQLAQDSAASPEVKQFAQKMIQDHGKAQQDLIALATARGVTPPKELPDAAQAVQRTLKALSGKAFDEEYIGEQVGDHVVALALYRHAAEHAQAPAVKDYAKRYASTIEQHLELARQLQQKVSGKS